MDKIKVNYETSSQQSGGIYRFYIFDNSDEVAIGTLKGIWKQAQLED